MVSEDTTGKLRLKMLAVCCNVEPDIEAILESLLNEYAKEKEDKLNLIKRCNLETFLYNVLKRKFNYESQAPSLKDFVLKLMHASYKKDIGESLAADERFTNDAFVFLKRWKDSRQQEEAFEKISQEIAEILDIESDIDSHEYKELLDCDIFYSIDKKILYSLTQEITKKTISKDDCVSVLRQRKNRRWGNKKEISLLKRLYIP